MVISLATNYNVVIERFLPTVAEYMLLEMTEEQRNSVLDAYIISAATEFNSACLHDLENRDEGNRCFMEDLSDEEIEILVDMMRVAWLKHKLYDSEKLRNGMSTKDYTVFSPANLLAELRDTYNNACESATNRLMNYTYTHNVGKIARLRKNGDSLFRY